MIRILLSSLAMGFVTLPVQAADLPAPLAAAVAEASTCENFSPSFTMKATGDPADGSLSLRYDAGTDEWTLLDGDMEELDEETRGEVETLKKDYARPCELTYRDMGDALASAHLHSETASEIIYDVVMQDDEDEMPDAMREAVEFRLHLDREGGHVTRFSMRSLKPFKPAAVAKIEDLQFEQHYDRLPAGHVVLTRLSSYAKGSALFRKFDEGFTLEFSDFSLALE